MIQTLARIRRNSKHENCSSYISLQLFCLQKLKCSTKIEQKVEWKNQENSHFKFKPTKTQTAVQFFSKLVRKLEKTFYIKNVALSSLYNFRVYEILRIVKIFGEPGV